MKRIVEKENREFNKEIESLCEVKGFDEKTDRVVSEIVNNVRKNGDDALIQYAEEFDKAVLSLSELKVDKDEIENAFNTVDERFDSAAVSIKDNIEKFYKKESFKPVQIHGRDGELLIQRVNPIDSVGIYIPGGSAPLVSTVLMTVVVAKIAGVRRIILATPPRKDGTINPYILAACRICGIEEVYKIGGAQAIAALAFGTETVPKVDKIVGPGNKYVVCAKRIVYGYVDIDMVAGPSEVLILGDDKSNPAFIAADILSQAEHDPDSRVFLVTDTASLTDEVDVEITRQLEELDRKKIIQDCLRENGYYIITETINKGVEVVNKIAPEHCEVMTQDPLKTAEKIVTAGAVFVGEFTPESVGDYVAGPSHVLPTGGSARFFSGLSVESFMRRSSLIYYTKDAFLRDSGIIEYMAQLEGLDAHARSVRMRLGD